MNLYYVDVKVFDTFEETTSLIRRAVIAADEANARDIVAKQMEEEIKICRGTLCWLRNN